MYQKTLFVSDLDGTLLSSKENLSDYTVGVINGLEAKGITFSYATARSLVTAREVTKGLNISMPVIVYNGAFVVNSLSGEVILSNYLTADEVNYLRDKFSGMNISPITYSYIDDKERFSFINEPQNIGKTAFLNKRRDSRRREVFTQNDLYEGKIFCFTCVGEDSEMLPMKEFLKNDNRFNYYYYKELYTDKYFCDITPKSVSKATAIRSLKEMFGFEKIISFGDETNDLQMFGISDECYAVANAIAELKARATGIIGSNDNDGVAKWFTANIV